jgi:hypothetical protein
MKNFFKEKPGDDTGMQTNVWGPAGWLFLHSIAQNYPWNPNAEKRKSYLKFFKTLAEVLPCGNCRDSYRSYITTMGLDTYLDYSKLKDRFTCTRWLYNVHSKVNEAIGKENIPFKDVWNRYESYRSKCNNKEKQIQTTNCSRFAFVVFVMVVFNFFYVSTLLIGFVFFTC